VSFSGASTRSYEAGRGSPRRRRRFLRRDDAERFEEEARRRRRLGELGESEWATRTVEELAGDWWELYVEPNLATRTKRDYARLLDRHVVPRLGRHRLREMQPEVVDRFRRDLERAGVGRSQVRQALAVLQGMFRYAEERGRVGRNPVKLVRKPSGKRQRAVVVLAPETVEAIVERLLKGRRIGDATLVALLAYTGVRPQEALALFWSHVRERTLLVEQKNVDGEIVAGQKRVRPPRSIDLIGPLRSDLVGWRMRLGNPRTGLVFPNRQGQPWREHDWLNWNRRLWTPTARAVGVGEPPYTLRHSYASLRIREGCSITELAIRGPL
jgi:integrase